MKERESRWTRGVVTLGITSVLAAATIAAPVDAALSRRAIKKIAKSAVKALAYTKVAADKRFQARIHWAQVAENGNIVAQSGGISLVDHSTSGFYYLNFPVTTPDKGIVATGTWGGSGGGGLAHVDACGGPPMGITCDFANTANGLLVEMESDAGTNLNYDFYVAVIA